MSGDSISWKGGSHVRWFVLSASLADHPPTIVGSDLGVVVTHTARGISHEDFGAEWRMIDIFTVDGDLIDRCELFEETDLDAALARFDELDRRFDEHRVESQPK